MLSDPDPALCATCHSGCAALTPRLPPFPATALCDSRLACAALPAPAPPTKVRLEHTEGQEMAKVEGQRNVQGSRDALKERQAERNKFLSDYLEGTKTAEAKIKVTC